MFLVTRNDTDMQFPGFYEECAYRDGQRDAASGHDNSRSAFMRHGEVEPLGMRWYEAGRLQPSHTPVTENLEA